MTNRARARDRGKDAERRLAKAIGGKRVITHGTKAPDVVTDFADYEVKYRSDIPDWIEEAIILTARKPGKHRYAVIFVHGRRDALVLESLSQHIADHGQVPL